MNIKTSTRIGDVTFSLFVTDAGAFDLFLPTLSTRASHVYVDFGVARDSLLSLPYLLLLKSPSLTVSSSSLHNPGLLLKVFGFKMLTLFILTLAVLRTRADPTSTSPGAVPHTGLIGLDAQPNPSCADLRTLYDMALL